MKKGWEIKLMSELFDITSSKRVFKADWKRKGVPFYRAREIVKLAENGTVNNELFISEDMYKEYSSKYGIPREGDIMITGVGTIGICYLVKHNDKFYFKDGNIIWLKKKSTVNSRFVEYAYKSDYLKKQVTDNSMGATVGTYTIISAKQTKIPLPPLPEQKRIVKILDKAFASIEKAKENAEKNLKNSRELFDSYLESIYHNPNNKWEKKKLKEVCLCTNNINWQLNKTKEFKYIDLSSVSRDIFSILETKLVSYKNAPSRAKKIVFNNDVIFGTTRPTLKRVTKIDKIYNGHICSTGFCVLRPDTKLILPEMIFYFLQTRTFMSKMETIQKGASYPAVTDNEVKNESLSVPSINEQKNIIKSFDSLSSETKKLEVLYQNKLTDLDELKKSILQKAFSGEL